MSWPISLCAKWKFPQRFFVYILISSTICRTSVPVHTLTHCCWDCFVNLLSQRETLFHYYRFAIVLVFFFEKWLRQIIVSEALVDLVIDIWVVNILHSWESPSTTTTTQPVQTWPFHRRKLKWRHSSATCTLIQINENEQLNYYRIVDYMVL